jgi:hypothetical protein
VRQPSRRTTCSCISSEGQGARARSGVCHFSAERRPTSLTMCRAPSAGRLTASGCFRPQ